MLNILLAPLARRSALRGRFSLQGFFKATIVASPLLVLLSSSPSAQTRYRMEYSVPQKVVIGQVVQESGEAKIMIASNAPFFITVQGVVGKICVRIAQNGMMQDKRFGVNAQLPGHKKTCTTLKRPYKQIIYRANRRTALLPGSPLSQSIVAHISYTKDATPVFSVPTLNELMRATG